MSNSNCFLSLSLVLSINSSYPAGWLITRIVRLSLDETFVLANRASINSAPGTSLGNCEFASLATPSSPFNEFKTNLASVALLDVTESLAISVPSGSIAKVKKSIFFGRSRNGTKAGELKGSKQRSLCG